MKEVLVKQTFTTFLLLMISVIANAQTYTSSNVYYFVPVGFTAQDVGEVVTEPNHASPHALGAYIIVDTGNGQIRTSLGPNNKRLSRDQIINGYNRSVRGQSGFLTYSYDSSLSNYKRNVYKRVVSSSMWGPGTIYYIAISKDWSSYVEWEEGRENRRVEYNRINIVDAIPEAPNHDFLYE